MSQWSVGMAQLPARKAMYFPLLSLGSYLYAIGGLDTAGAPMDDISRYDVVNDAWTLNYGVLPVAISRHCAVEYEDEIWIIGGLR